MSDARRLVLAFDYGRKRIGIATANLLTRTATPLTTLNATGGIPWPSVDAIFADWRPDLIVVGHPGPAAAEGLLAAVDTFINELTARYALPVEQVDESFTSVAAQSELRAGREEGIYNRRIDKAHIDAHAACLIAEQWMNEALERH
jgi:putative Holliday junction resolvase